MTNDKQTTKIKHFLKRVFKPTYLNLGYIEQLNKRGVKIYS